ncbi:hypothetical protein BU23DRAFT_569717 [Bimuria novae-zelandiae CBS 107.79]|uniref:F-box domain-containing protein n=1 Tax=Bimuria novae-zelandiae CBS 107.79 TaxID=1447943 RepID=A0A6A5V5M1_9PLEO|nr:hypothetical protein BU23DRAFT_569717 [Bimuria novae-zelandiae CBS 107.79]
MNKLPQELVDNISRYLDRDDLKNTLLLSRQVQYAAERYSGAFSTYILNKHNSDRFLKIYEGQRFFRYLRRVEFRTSVRGLEGEANRDHRDNPCRDSAEELRQMDEDFTLQIHFLISKLYRVEIQARAVKSLGPRSIEFTIYTPTRTINRGIYGYCLHRVFTSWAFQTIGLPTKLRHARLNFVYPINYADRVDQSLAMPNFTELAKYDIFSNCLRLLSSQLRTMTLRLVADKTIFWPTDGTTPFWPHLESLSVMFYLDSLSGSWYFRGLRNEGPSEGFDITKDSYPPLEDTEEDEASDYPFDWDSHCAWSRYRFIPNDDLLVPFLAAFAKATTRMPSLKQAALWAPLMFGVDFEEHTDFAVSEVSKYCEDSLAWDLSYVRPGTKAFLKKPGEDFSTVRQFWWKVGKWRPDAALLDRFQEVGRKEHGSDLKVYLEDFDAGSGLMSRDFFESWEAEVFG